MFGVRMRSPKRLDFLEPTRLGSPPELAERLCREFSWTAGKRIEVVIRPGLNEGEVRRVAVVIRGDVMVSSRHWLDVKPV